MYFVMSDEKSWKNLTCVPVRMDMISLLSIYPSIWHVAAWIKFISITKQNYWIEVQLNWISDVSANVNKVTLTCGKVFIVVEFHNNEI